MRSFVLLMLCWLAFACQPLDAYTEPLPDKTGYIIVEGAELPSITSIPAHVEIAQQYVGVTEITHNSSPEIDRFLASVNLRPGNPWCAAFVSYTLSEANVSYPPTRSGLARHFIRNTSIDAREFVRGTYTPEHGDIIVWKRGNTIFGHLAILESFEDQTLFTIEGNTSPGATGSTGDGVYRRERTVNPGAYFRITHFTNVRYATG